MDFQTAVTTCPQKFADANGRAPRSEFWWFALAVFILQVAATIIEEVIHLSFLTWIVWLAVIVPYVTVGIRRLHDLDKQGVLIILAFIPIVNFYMLYLFVQRGTIGANQYGEDPLPQALPAA